MGVFAVPISPTELAQRRRNMLRGASFPAGVTGLIGRSRGVQRPLGAKGKRERSGAGSNDHARDAFLQSRDVSVRSTFPTALCTAAGVRSCSQM
jgi:hypothetical protein